VIPLGQFERIKKIAQWIFGGDNSSTVEWDGKTDPIKGAVAMVPTDPGRYLLSNDKKIYTPLDSGYIRGKVLKSTETTITALSSTRAQIAEEGEIFTVNLLANDGSSTRTISITNEDAVMTGTNRLFSNGFTAGLIVYNLPSLSDMVGPAWAVISAETGSIVVTKKTVEGY
jgi:hypothetical protein